ncbi:hypothetical protein [Microbacterium rhizophilus]|uniref:hypothetical protein n=1 Tax=Microbacterium rhizophilus TaxID=3138934 RepID=UPI0031E7FF61
MSDLLDRLAQRKMPQQDVRICLDPALLEEHARAKNALVRAITNKDKAEESDGRMISAKPAGVAEARRAVADVETRINAASLTLRIMGVDRATYNGWMLACPPRKNKQEPFDSSKFFMHAAKNSAVYVDGAGAEHEITAEEWALIDKNMTDGEHDRIAQAVIYVNRSLGGQDVGFFENGSDTTTDSFGISGSRGASASPRAVSGAGSRKRSASRK